MSIPKQLKHCTMEVFKKLNPPPIEGDFERAKFINAWNICFAKFQQNGYGYVDNQESGTIEDKIKLTEKGMKREIEHLADTSNRAAQFDRFYQRYQGLL